MKDLIIIGAGDFGRETLWVAERINQKSLSYRILGFADDKNVGKIVAGYPVLGNIEWLCQYPNSVGVVCAIANGKMRESILNKVSSNESITQETLIDPTAIIGDSCKVSTGCIICAGTVMTVDVSVGSGCIVNLNSTLGHDTTMKDFCTIHPGCNIAGKVLIGRRTLIGTGSQIIQGVGIADDTIIGAGSVVIRDITESGVYVGIPVKKIKEGMNHARCNCR